MLTGVGSSPGNGPPICNEAADTLRNGVSCGGKGNPGGGNCSRCRSGRAANDSIGGKVSSSFKSWAAAAIWFLINSAVPEISGCVAKCSLASSQWENFTGQIGHLWSMSIMCRLSCIRKLPLCANVCPQNLQVYGFWPVWILSWVRNVPIWVNDFPHVWHLINQWIHFCSF